MLREGDTEINQTFNTSLVILGFARYLRVWKSTYDSYA